MTVIRIVIRVLGTVTKRLLKGLEELEIRNGDHPNYNIINIGQNTDKGPGDLLALKFHWNTIS